MFGAPCVSKKGMTGGKQASLFPGKGKLLLSLTKNVTKKILLGLLEQQTFFYAFSEC
jgi:hypothetical protein